MAIKVQGVNRTARAIERSRRLLNVEMARSAEDIAERTENIAISLAPTDQGLMASNIRSRPLDRALGSLVTLQSSDFPDDFYPRFVHYGTKFVSARPFLEDAAEANIPGARASYRSGIRRWKRRIRKL